jgi:hypothetical protein
MLKKVNHHSNKIEDRQVTVKSKFLCENEFLKLCDTSITYSGIVGKSALNSLLQTFNSKSIRK